MKKINFILASLLIIAVFLAGCSSSTKPNAGSGAASDTSTAPTASKSPAPQKEVTLRYAVWGAQPTYQKVVDAFMKENPNIKVELQVTPWANFWDKLFTELAGGTGPDVFWGHPTRLPSLMEKDVLMDITDKIKKDNIDMSKYSDAITKMYMKDGKNYAIPQQWSTIGIIYNEDLLKKAGFSEYPKDLAWNPKDGGTFVQFLQKLTLDKNGKHPNEAGFDPKNIVQYGYNYIDKDQIDPGQFIGYAAANGGAVLDADGKLAYNDKLLETYQFLYDLTYKYYVAPSYTTIHTGGSEAKFVGQQIAVWNDGNWMMTPLKQKAGFNWKITSIPAGPQGKVATMLGLSDVINAKTKYPEEAWKLIKFITSKTGQDIIGGTGAYFPGNSDSYNAFLDFYKSQGIDATPFAENAKLPSVNAPVTKNYNDWLQIWTKYTSLMLSGEMDPKTTLDKIKAEGDPVAIK
ncbi:ABC transporter substrate-binding protein [Paenibacillus thalictri]|uniref:Extracellular solute-binding protein n=1 Tax=Paenibacillus thalictri TaxID=2527873 RepID=A0A4Q9DTQ3_9BACL|nr:sugar ABC transporter substrate-binding protein [Paenibacillus thalictri]TBL79080.1 extracellular solute-binding protein [Paenibacillus thalictri]